MKIIQFRTNNCFMSSVVFSPAVVVVVVVASQQFQVKPQQVNVCWPLTMCALFVIILLFHIEMVVKYLMEKFVFADVLWRSYRTTNINDADTLNFCQLEKLKYFDDTRFSINHFWLLVQW